VENEMQDREDGKEDVVKSLIASTSVTRITNENVHKGLNHVKKKTDVRTRSRRISCTWTRRCRRYPSGRPSE